MAERRPGFALLTLLLLFVLVEGGARLFMAGLDPTGFDDASWRNAWLRDHSDKGEIFYGFDRFDASKGWISKPGLRDVPAFGGETLSTNSFGLRGARELSDSDSKYAQRILVLGDSFTFGDEVADDETYVQQLEERLPATRVLNFGVHGYGHDQMLILLRELGKEARPDVVLLGFVYADIHRNLLGFRDFAKPRFEFAGDALQLRGLPLPTPEIVARSRPFRLRLLDVFRVAGGLLRARSGALDDDARELTRHILDGLLREVSSLGATALFVYLPVEGEIEDVSADPTDRERFLLDFCRERSVACTSLRTRFSRAHTSGARLRTIGHWGPAGHRIAAEGIAEFVSAATSPSSDADVPDEKTATTSSMIE